MASTQRVAVVLSIVNLALLIALLAQHQSAAAKGELPILRGRGIELVDAAGQLRVEVHLGTEEALFRMRDPKGVVRVKLGAATDGSGLLLLDETTEPGVQIIARRVATSTAPNTTGIQLTGPGGQRRAIAP